jgi:hypothetical protein
MLTLLNSGKHSDVTFVVDDEHVRAHAQILCARSEVFDKLLSCGMQESVSKEIVIEDGDCSVFKVLLKFLYTDSLVLVEDDIAAIIVSSSAGSGERVNVVKGCLRITLLQSLLAASHKYQVARLQSWCEQQLCECISAEDVCSILCQAHLHEAKSLEQFCLVFIKDEIEKVAKTQGFGNLAEIWPEVMLKINLHIASVSESDAAQAIQAQQEARRKRQKCFSSE